MSEAATAHQVLEERAGPIGKVLLVVPGKD